MIKPVTELVVVCLSRDVLYRVLVAVSGVGGKEPFVTSCCFIRRQTAVVGIGLQELTGNKDIGP